jgi:thiol-disulfide isomerase/thioredoxin
LSRTSLFRSLLWALGLVLVGCAAPNPDADAPAPEREQAREPFRTVSTSERVPAFRVVADDGSVFDSDALVGKRPFVVVFFATWCGVCELLFPAVHDVFDENADVPVIGVSLDDSDTWGQVPGYVRRHALRFPWVRAESFPRFTLAYDPLQRVPVVAVVGKNGYLVDYQVGYSYSERRRLVAALAIAKRMRADSPPFVPDRPDAPSL